MFNVLGFDKHLELYILQANLNQDLGISVPFKCILQYLESKWHKNFNVRNIIYNNSILQKFMYNLNYCFLFAGKRGKNEYIKENIKI